MNVNKLEEIQRKILSASFVEKKSCEPATEFPAPVNNIEGEIQRSIQEIGQERRIIDRDFLALKTPTNTQLEIIPFPDPLSKDGNKILAQQSETLRQLVAEQMLVEKNFNERKSSFAKKKSELHKKFLQIKGR